MKKALLYGSILILAMGFSMTAMADILTTYGDATVIPTPGSPPPPPQPYVWQLTSTNPNGYAGLQLQITSGLTPDTLTTLSATYLMTQGTFYGGAPRFTLFDGSLNAAYIYWGTPLGGGSFSDPCGGTAWCSTGNYADPLSADIRVYSNGFGGDNNPNTGVTWAQFLALVGNTGISYITLDLDAGFIATQQMLVSDWNVNGQDYAAPEPGTLVLMSSAMLGLACRFRRRINP